MNFRPTPLKICSLKPLPISVCIAGGGSLTLYSDYSLYAFLREFRGNTIIVVLNNSPVAASTPFSVPISSNTNVPGRIKQNLLSRKTLINLFNADDQLEYQPEGNITVQMEGKTAKVYRLQD